MKLVLLMSLLPGIILKDDCCTSIPEGSFSTTSGATDTPTGSASETEMDSQSETGVEPVPLDRAVVFVTRSWLRGDEALEAEVACAQEAATAGQNAGLLFPAELASSYPDSSVDRNPTTEDNRPHEGDRLIVRTDGEHSDSGAARTVFERDRTVLNQTSKDVDNGTIWHPYGMLDCNYSASSRGI